MRPIRSVLGTARMFWFGVLGLVMAACVAVDDPNSRRATDFDVIVQSTSAERAAEAVRDAGGTVARRLALIDAVSGSIPSPALGALRHDRRVAAVSANAPVRVAGVIENESTLKPVWTTEMRADVLHASGYDGSGTTIALIDTGVTTEDIPGLHERGRLKPIFDDVGMPVGDCVNFAGDGTCEDEFGHGTFLAGLMVAHPDDSAGRYGGIAPGARLVSIKVAGADGSSDVSKVIAAIDWAVANRSQYGISVINLSLGTDSNQSFDIDPLNRAVQSAWDAGITVVVAAGNRGPGISSISKPGDDPLAITVGAVDDRETPATDDDRVPNFSSRGPTAAIGIGTRLPIPKPDVAAPGAKVVAAVPPSSTLGSLPASRHVAAPYRRGSGTSMSAALVSGGIALLRQGHPTWTPGQIKTALRSTATKVGVSDPLIVGAGLVDLADASRLPSPADANAGIRRSNGSGFLEESRGTVEVVATCSQAVGFDPQCGEKIEDERTAQGLPWNSAGYGSVTSLGTSWYGTSWYGTSWYGTSWYRYETADGSIGGGGSSDSSTSYGTDAPASALYGIYG